MISRNMETVQDRR